MTTQKYVTIRDSVGYKTKFFRVIQGGYKPTLTKRMTINETVDGRLDVSQGKIYEHHNYVVRVREEEDDSSYGTKSDLEWFYRLNDPGGSPTDVITMIDHFGVEHQGYMIGDFLPEPVTTIIEGLYAWFLIPVDFRFIPL